MGAAASRSSSIRRVLLSGSVLSLLLAFAAILQRRRRSKEQRCLASNAPKAKAHAVSTSGRTPPAELMNRPAAVPPQPSRPAPSPAQATAARALPPPPSRPAPKANGLAAAGVNGSTKLASPDDLGIEVWVCLDFEWTCDDGPQRRVRCDEGEIIEFAFVVFDAVLNRQIAQGQHFVKNLKTPITEKCTNLTGISDDTLANAGTLADALIALEAILTGPEVAGRRCCACAHGAADLELMLPMNCGNLGLQVPAELRKYVDLREATQHYVHANRITSTKASSLRQICEEALKLEMIGDEHCGLDDAWMVLLALQQLLKRSSSMEFIDLDAEREAFLQANASHDDPFSKALCLDGLPRYSTAEDLRPWLRGITGISVQNDALFIVLGLQGEPCFRAVVDFGSWGNAAKALKAFGCGKRFVCGPKRDIERLVLARPLRRAEKVLLEHGRPAHNGNGNSRFPAVAPFPPDQQALDAFKPPQRPSLTEGTGYAGTLHKLFSDRGFGFIHSNDGTDAEVYVNTRDLKSGIDKGCRVAFDVIRMPDGKTRAVNVTRL